MQGFGITEIQNSEGRYVNAKLEYGYTDHLGNLRLSYKDSLGVAFITQSQSYDPWSNVNAGSEYQLAGIQGDRYLVSGKENDSVTGNTLLDWRDYDSVTGRMNSYDPEDQSMSMSGFAYCGNNPVSHIDPDGRELFTVLSLLWTGYNLIRGYVNDKNSGASTGQAIGNTLFGIGISCITAGIGDGIGNEIAGSVFRGASNTFKSVASRVISGGISGGLGSGINGGNFLEGVGRGAATSLAFESAERGIKGIKRSINKARDKNIPYGGELPGINVTVSKQSQAGKEIYANWLAEQRYRNRYSPYNADGFGISGSIGFSGFGTSASFDGGFVIGNDGAGIFGSVSIGVGGQAPGVGLGLNANFYDKYGGELNFIDGLRGDGVGYDANAFIGGGYSSSAQTSPYGFSRANQGTQTVTFGLRPSLGNYGARRTYSKTQFLWDTVKK